MTVVFAVFGLALLSLLLGYGIGVLLGGAYVWLAHVTSFEGYSGMLIFLTFGPIGALLGAVALPGLYLSHLARGQARRR